MSTRSESLKDKLRALFHTAGANTSDTNALISNLMQYTVAMPAKPSVGNSNATSQVSYQPNRNVKLVSAKFCNQGAALNSTAGNTVTFSVTCNGVSVASVNTDGASLNAVAANAIEDLSVNTVNSFVNSGTNCVCTVTHEDNVVVDGVFLLEFEIQ